MGNVPKVRLYGRRYDINLTRIRGLYNEDEKGSDIIDVLFNIKNYGFNEDSSFETRFF